MMQKQIPTSIEENLVPLVEQILSPELSQEKKSFVYEGIHAVTSRKTLQDESYSAEADRLLGDNLPTYYKNQQHDEAALETRWAEQILASSNPWQVLEQHPYFQNYQELVASELEQISDERKVDFYGSGPLPFSAILYARNLPAITITCYDIDPKAIQLSKKLINHLDISDQVRVVKGDASQPKPSAVTCILAACVGETAAQKVAITTTLLDSYTFVLARTTCGLATLHYPQIPSSFQDQMKLHLKPKGTTINTTLVLSKD